MISIKVTACGTKRRQGCDERPEQIPCLPGKTSDAWREEGSPRQPTDVAGKHFPPDPGSALGSGASGNTMLLAPRCWPGKLALQGDWK